MNTWNDTRMLLAPKRYSINRIRNTDRYVLPLWKMIGIRHQSFLLRAIGNFITDNGQLIDRRIVQGEKQATSNTIGLRPRNRLDTLIERGADNQRLVSLRFTRVKRHQLQWHNKRADVGTKRMYCVCKLKPKSIIWCDYIRDMSAVSEVTYFDTIHLTQQKSDGLAQFSFMSLYTEKFWK